MRCEVARFNYHPFGNSHLPLGEPKSAARGPSDHRGGTRCVRWGMVTHGLLQMGFHATKRTFAPYGGLFEAPKSFSRAPVGEMHHRDARSRLRARRRFRGRPAARSLLGRVV
jgi:hypothetical protein